MTTFSGQGSQIYNSHFYGATCDACEDAWSERMEAWARGANDPEAEAIYGPADKDKLH